MPGDSPQQRRIYLDNAATSWPKPEAVYAAVDDYLRLNGAPAGRSGYAEAARASQAVENVRRQVATLLGLGDASHLIFTFNGTDSLNLAIHGLLKPGDHVITSVVEHNSVLRPLAWCEEAGMISVTRVACDRRGVVDPDDFRAALRRETRLVALIHASNVTGAVQPVAEVARIAHEAGALVLCDAAQSAGHVPVAIDELGADFLALPGHKGLLGPLGTGVLAIQPAAARHLQSIRQGGTGTQSEQARQPDALPYRFESGNLNVPGILGMGAGVAWLIEQGLANLQRRAEALTDRLLDGLRSIRGITLFGPPSAQDRVPLVSIAIEGYDPQEAALWLDAAHRIQVRAGLHCAGAMHESLGTTRSGGTLRFSLGPFSSDEDIDRTIAAVAEFAAAEM